MFYAKQGFRARFDAPGLCASSGDKLKLPKLIIEISRGLGAEAKLFRAHNFQVADNSTLVITDVHGQAHYIPMRMWERIEIRRVPSAAHADEATPA